MKTRLIWKECSLTNDITSFWVECTDEEVIREILPSLKEYNAAFFQELKQNRGQSKINDVASNSDRCHFFLVSKDAEQIQSFSWVMPFSGLWNGGNPFEEFAVVDFNHLSELERIYCDNFENINNIE